MRLLGFTARDFTGSCGGLRRRLVWQHLGKICRRDLDFEAPGQSWPLSDPPAPTADFLNLMATTSYPLSWEFLFTLSHAIFLPLGCTRGHLLLKPS